MKHLAVAIAILMWATALWAEETRYVMRVDGLACPFCAYGVEKKLKKIEGVEAVDIDLNSGVVTVDVLDGVELNEPDMRELFNDAGFTYRSMAKEAR